MRAFVFFVALSVLAKATFPEVSSRLATMPGVFTLPPVLVELVVHLPFAVVVGLIGWHAGLWRRLPAHPAWYVLLAVVAAAQLLAAVPWIRLQPFVPYVKPALLAAVVIVLLRVGAKAGTIYETSRLPGVRVFVGLVLLLAASFHAGDELFREPRLLQAYYALKQWFPVPEVILSIPVVAAFMLASRLWQRPVQPTAARHWLLAGIVLFVLGEGLRQASIHALRLQAEAPGAARHVVQWAAFGLPLRFLGHLALFLGAFYLFAHLAPRRPVDPRR